MTLEDRVVLYLLTMGNQAINNTSITKAVLTDLATKKELKKTERNLRVEILKVEERVEILEEKVDGLDKKLDGVEKKLSDKLNSIANTIDGFVGRVDDLSTDNEVGAAQIHDLRETAKDHEKRIAKLESPN